MRWTWLEWILHPAAPYAALAASVLLLMCLFLSVKREIRTLARRGRQSREERQQEMAAFRASLEEAKAAIGALERDRQAIEEKAAMLRPQPGMNLTKRSQALHMHRRGESPESIAGALGLPVPEVDLLLKIHSVGTRN